MKRRINFTSRRVPVLIAVALCIAMMFTQVFCYAAYNTVPTKMFPKVTGVELLKNSVHQNTGETHQMELRIKFSNNVSAIDEEQERDAVNASDPNYMIGVNQRNLTKFHMVKKDTQEEVSGWTVEPHPQAEKQTDPSKYFYIYADNLEESTDYQVLIDEDLYANMGNSLGVPYIVDFNLSAETCSFHADGQVPEDEHSQAPLTLDLINLENNQKDVPADIEIFMRFSFNVAGDEVFQYNAQQISLTESEDSSKKVDIDVQKGGEVQEIKVKPKAALASGTEYHLIISNQFVARNGIALASPLGIYFTVAGEKQNPDEDDSSDGNEDSEGSSGGSGNSGDDAGGSSSGGSGDGSDGSSSGSSGGGSGGSSSGNSEDKSGEDNTPDNNEKINLENTKNGNVTIENKDAEAGDIVTLSVVPDNGFILDSIMVTDSEGNKIELTEQNGKYKFTMPDSNITIKTVFVEDNEYIEDYFTDIESSWARKDINKLADLGVVTGNPDGTFRVNSQITRAEIVTILVRLYDLDSETAVSFEDTKNHWASGYISIAAALGYVNGFDANRFGPNESLTRQQMAVMLSRIAGLTSNASVNGGQAQIFTDIDTVSAWAADAVAAVYENGIVNGYPDGTFRPSAYITRAEACHMIVNLMEKQSQAA